MKTWLKTHKLTYGEFTDILKTLLLSERTPIVINDDPAPVAAPTYVRLSWLDDRAPIEVYKDSTTYYYVLHNKQPQLVRAQSDNGTELRTRYSKNNIIATVWDGKSNKLIYAIIPISPNK